MFVDHAFRGPIAQRETRVIGEPRHRARSTLPTAAYGPDKTIYGDLRRPYARLICSTSSDSMAFLIRRIAF